MSKMKADPEEKKKNKKKVEAIKKAVNVKRKRIGKLDTSPSLIKGLKSRLQNEIVVECPKCGHEMRTGPVKTKKCIRCGSSFTVWPKSKPSRVVYCDPDLKPLLFRLLMARDGIVT